MKRFLILLLAVGLLLSCLGCSGETLQETQGTEAPQDTEQPSDADIQNTPDTDDPQWAEILAGPLTKDADYCAESSGYAMAETEDGYYLIIGRVLCYADKSDLSAWYPVCSDPTCDHTSADQCHAFLPGTSFTLKDGRIHFVCDESSIIQAASDKWAVYSMGLDGSDLQEDYCFDTALTRGNNFAHVEITREYAYANFGFLDATGTWAYKFMRANASGTDVLREDATIESDMVKCNNMKYFDICGRYGISCEVLGGDSNTVFFPTEDGGLDVVTGGDDLHLEGACVLDDVIYHYEPGEGFYRSDLDGNNSVLITENQLENGYGYCATERLYLESNIAYNVTLTEPPVLLLFDGEDWYDLELPEDFREDTNTIVNLMTVTSERLFIKTYDYDSFEYRLYSVDLSQKPYTLELNATIDDPYRFGS